MAVMFNAGLPLHHILHHLEEHNEDPVMGQVAGGLARRVMGGQSLSGSMHQFPGAFGKFALHLVKVGESSGKLHAVLESLARHEEWSLRARGKLRSALVYPAFSLALCLLMALLGPPYLLRGHLQILRDSGAELPWLTRGLILLSDLVRSPVFLMILVLTLPLLFLGLRRWLHRTEGRRRLYRLLDTIPVVSAIIRISSSARFARSMAALLEAGVNLRLALPLAFSSTDHPHFEAQGHGAVQRLINGATLLGALKEVPYLDSMFCSALEAGEESGKVSDSMTWVACLHEQELEASFERLGAVLEPLLMLFTGTCVGLVLVATLSPTISLLENF